MNAMIDVSCAKCSKRFGWCGRMSDRPPCPRCGHRPDPAALAEADARMDADRALIDASPTAQLCRQQRVLAGLTLRQAAKLLETTLTDLSAIEQGRAPLGDDLAKKMSEIYCVGG